MLCVLAGDTDAAAESKSEHHAEVVVLETTDTDA